MSRLWNRDEIRRRLERDRPWAAYALGDLAPGYCDHSEWYGDRDADALALIYRVGEWPILFTLGEPDALPAALEHLAQEPRLSLSIRPEHRPAVEARWQVRRCQAMWRMLLAPSTPPMEPAHPVIPVRAEDEASLRRLFQDGRPTAEEPDFFLSHMLADGTYFGVCEGDEWIAAAGTHLVAASEGVATVGNVYVRRDRRGQGLARSVVAAVIAELRRRKIPTVALNVRQSNAAALWSAGARPRFPITSRHLHPE